MYSSLCLRNGKIRSPLNPKSVKSRSVKSRVDCIVDKMLTDVLNNLLGSTVLIKVKSISTRYCDSSLSVLIKLLKT